MQRRMLFLLLLILIFHMTDCETEAVTAKANHTVDVVTKKSRLANKPQIVHGLGYIAGHFVTNSKEALLVNYERGFRVFEVDLNMTSDHRLVARHDWYPERFEQLGQYYLPIYGPLPYDTVMALKIHGKYSVLSWEDILDLMQKYPDISFVTDTKEKDEANVRKTFSYIVKTTKQRDPKLLERIIPQIYNQQMLGYIRSYYDFHDIILTLYHYSDENLPSPKELADWSANNHVTAIAGFPFRLTEDLRNELQQKNITIYAHTINNPTDAVRFMDRGIGIYTDYLLYDGEKFVGPQKNFARFSIHRFRPRPLSH